MKKILLILAGSLALGLGTLGIFLPLLPTVPFLLLAAACYVRSSERLTRWLLSHRYLGKIIVDFQQKKVIPRRTKLFTVALLWLSIGISAAVVNLLWVRIVLLCVATGVTVHILSFKSSPRR
jgi:uncharacterized membrane protein YbaN (DUF454 family)